MAFFLKVQNQANNTYLAIYESFYSPDRKGTKHRCVQSLGSVTKLKGLGIEDPVSYYKAKVEQMNADRKQETVQLISSVSPEKYLGYFPLKALLEKLEIKKYIDLFKLTTDYDFDLYEVLSSLIYARCVNPCSKRRTYNEVLPSLYEGHAFSYDQLLEGIAFYGNDYEKIIELFNMQIREKYRLDTDITYFDCTNFYFEIDKEDAFRKKGPSKENRKDPIVGMGLLLDAHQIPVGMKLYPGNESEKPVIREVIRALKERHEIEGRTIHVADKGLNCAANIFFARKNGDGYLFSKSVKQLPDTEKAWVLLETDYHAVKDEHGSILYYWKECIDKFPYRYEDETGKIHTFTLTEKRVVTYNPSLAAKKRYEINRIVEKAKGLTASLAKRSEYGESARYVTFKGKDSDENVKAILNQSAIDEDLRLAGFNLLVTSEIGMKAQDIYRTYHNLWRIEESFRIMKSDLDARPVFLQKEETIKGHFLICYLTVLLERIFQFLVLKDKPSSSDIFSFFKNFRVVETDGKYINVTIGNDFITKLADFTNLPLNHYSLSERQLKKVLNFRL